MSIVVRKKARDFSIDAEELAERILGPVINRWLLALHQYVSYLDDGDTEFLFCTRAGLRIKKLYDAHIGVSPDTESPGKLFWSSRFGVCKGTFNRFSAGAAEVMTREYAYDSLASMIRGILRNVPELLNLINIDAPVYQERGASFGKWLQDGTTDARIVASYLTQCGIAFDAYLADLIGARKTVVLIDSGWQGTAQWLLANAYPEIEWKGLYFGRILSSQRDPAFVDHVIGLMFEADRYLPSVPLSAITHFHHLIERLLEPSGPSMEEIPAGNFKPVAKKQITANLKASARDTEDPLFRGVLRYVENARSAGASISDIIAEYETVLPEFERLILFPTRQEALALGTSGRSADFGKSLKVPILRLPEEFSTETPEDRIERSLWKQGQIALEGPPDDAVNRQQALSGITRDELATLRAHPPFSAVPNIAGSVAIITRTKNRPLLLRRAAQSVASQTHKNYIWVIVNDGGDTESVKKVIENCAVERHKILLINNRNSRGMEAASNLGIRNSQSDFIVIHDDDDSWSASFLETTVGFLLSKKGSPYGGVIARSMYVSEEIQGNKIVEHGRWPYQDWVRNVQLCEMARGNFFPPIAFVFRRSVYEEIGGYNEDLPVLGDWFFNMEFLLRADIGVVRDTVAFYHHRDVGSPKGDYANSVIGGISKHEEYASIARNAFLRKHGNNVAACSAVAGYFAQETKQIERKLDGTLRGVAVDWNAGDEGGFARLEAELDRLWLINELNSEFVLRNVSTLDDYRDRRINVNASLDDLVSAVLTHKLPVRVPPYFDEDAYLNRYRDVAEACKEGLLLSGYMHYLGYGKTEGRKRFRK